MPDLITHMSFNYIIYKIYRKRFNLILFLAGAIIPDLPISLKIFLIDFLHYYQNIEYISALTHLLHTLLISLLFSISIGVLFEKVFGSIISLYTGILLHLFLDFLQNSWSNGLLLFFPFYNKPFSLNLFTYGIEFKYFYVILPALILVYLWRKERAHLKFTLNFKRISISIGILILIILISWLNIEKVINSGVLCLDFRFNSQKYDNRIIVLNRTPVVSVEPIKIYYRGKKLTLENVKIPLKKHDKVILKGIYKHNQSRINVIEIHRVNFIKQIISFTGLLFFLCIVIRSLI